MMGSLLLESFFGIPGLGDMMLSSIQQRDMPVISGFTFVSAVFYVGANIITDLLYATVDPRVTLG
jgi:peptide/nickel transport system permease protein